MWSFEVPSLISWAELQSGCLFFKVLESVIVGLTGRANPSPCNAGFKWCWAPFRQGRLPGGGGSGAGLKDKWNHPARIGEGDLGRWKREQARVGGPAPDTDGKRWLLRFLLTLRFWQSQVKFQSHPTSPEVNAGVSTESLRCKHPSSLGTTRLFKSILASPKSPLPSWGGGFEMESQALKTDRQRTGQARSPKATGCGQVKQEKAI